MEDKPKRRRKVDDDAKLAEGIRRCADAIQQLVAWQKEPDDLPHFSAYDLISQAMDEVIASVASVNAGHALKDPT